MSDHVSFSTKSIAYEISGFINDDELIEILNRIIPWIDFIVINEGSETGEHYSGILHSFEHLIPVLSYGDIDKPFKDLCVQLENNLWYDLNHDWIKDWVYEDELDINGLPELKQHLS